MKIVFSWDDGAKDDLKLFELHRKYSIPGMFFVPNYNSEGRDVLSQDDILSNRSELISFGGHTANHVYLTTIDPDKIDGEIAGNKAYLEGVLGEKIDHFCLPGGKYTRNILKSVFKYFKTCRTADTVAIKKPRRLIKPTIHFYNRGKRSLLLNSIKHLSFSGFFFILLNIRKNYFELVRAFIDFEARRGSNRVIHVWGHSWELEEKELWEELEALFLHISSDCPNLVCSYSEAYGGQKR